MVSSVVNSDIRHRLKAISDGYSDRLRPQTRANILSSLAGQTAGQAARTAHLRSPFIQTVPRMLAAAAVLVVLALPAIQMKTLSGKGPETPIRDLEVNEVDGRVVLTWKDGNQPHRVVRATSREELARLSKLPSETVSGERWVDNRPIDAREPNSSNVVYYFVE